MSVEGQTTGATGDTAQEVGAATGTVVAPDAGPTTAGRARGGFRRQGFVLEFLERFGLVLLLIGEIAFFSIWHKTGEFFFTWDNFRVIAANQSVLSIAALASILPLIGGSFDLSIGAIALLADIATGAVTAHHGWPLGVAIVIAVAFGAAIGLANGIVVARAGVNALITTLGTFYVIIGVILWYTGGNAIVTGVSPDLTGINVNRWLGVPQIAVFMIIAAVVIWYLLAHTPWGRYLHAVGSNPIAARLVGINIERVVVISFILSGTFAAIAGVLMLAHSGSAFPNVNNASGLLLPALASAFLGATTIRPGRFNVVGTLVGVFFIAVAVQGLTLAGVTDWVQYVLYGATLVAAVALSAIIGRRRGRV
jgi:ribose transport system permease protein